ncbi:anti-sigma factor [Pandoraea terrae]|uniref:Anti-sigma factor n=1 Tax=Pandoraea terrae TaxID=1537710 RepID=A0A5E4Y3B8_9BURK|nr:cupin domain-containing protein [Pandoraea terrae]VVE43126.1 anti-sigma factor [Pandoraea terrae]
MFVNADFTRRAVVATDQYEWVDSPQSGVERILLDRLGGEKARATSIVRYAPASCFPRHQHPGGEEILVLAGEFFADGQRYIRGSWIRLPAGEYPDIVAAENGATVYLNTGHLAGVVAGVAPW